VFGGDGGDRGHRVDAGGGGGPHGRHHAERPLSSRRFASIMRTTASRRERDFTGPMSALTPHRRVLTVSRPLTSAMCICRTRRSLLIRREAAFLKVTAADGVDNSNIFVRARVSALRISDLPR
jgi:hypothetical protein